ncbi:hypothetical protein AB3X52_02965 [Nocardioides sp. DS6]|uniref:Uncharacterized protein n=1 Tax=Nocardioides eburneus TaxID=3231482 RepID=A0ABV3SUF0_9ACTN
MSTQAPREDGPDYRLLVLAAIVPVLVIAAILVRVIANRPHDSNAHPATLTLNVPAQAPTTPCGTPDASALAAQASAVEATVTSIDGSTVTFQPKRFFRGSAERVQLRQLGDATPSALQLPTFEQGRTYLLAAGSDGTLAGCGLSGPESSSLEKLYTSAFG